MNSRILRRSIFISISTLGAANAWAGNYVVRPGDTLSVIAHETIPGRIWGPRGSLAKILALNPSVKNSDLIYPGQELRLSEESIAETNQPLRKIASESEPDTIPAQAPAVLNPTINEDYDDQHLTAGLGYHFKTYTAVDNSSSGTAKLFTSSDIEFNAGWSHQWSRNFSTHFDFGFEKLDFEPSNNSAKPLVNTSQSPARMSLGADVRASHLVFKTSASYGQELFTGSQNNGISIDSVFVPAFSEERNFKKLWI